MFFCFFPSESYANLRIQLLYIDVELEKTKHFWNGWMEISGTPKSSILIGFSWKKPSILGCFPYFWKHPNGEKKSGERNQIMLFQFQWHDIPEGFFSLESVASLCHDEKPHLETPRLYYLTVWRSHLKRHRGCTHTISTHTWYKHLPLKIPKFPVCKPLMGFWSYVVSKIFVGWILSLRIRGCFMIRIDLKYTYCWIGWGNTTNSFFNVIQKNFDDFDVCPICVFNTLIVDPALNGFRFGRHLYSGLEGPVHGLVVVLPSNSERRLKSKTSICCGTFGRGTPPLEVWQQKPLENWGPEALNRKL